MSWSAASVVATASPSSSTASSFACAKNESQSFGRFSMKWIRRLVSDSVASMSSTAYGRRSSGTSPSFPGTTVDGVLDLAELRPGQRIVEVHVKDPDEPQAGPSHHRTGAVVDCHRVGDDPVHAEFGERLVDERFRAFGRVALAPRRTVEPVADVDRR